MSEKVKKFFSNIMGILIVIVIGSLVVYGIFHLNSVKNIFLLIINILKPILYGLFIAYILKPMCIYFEALFGRMLHAVSEQRREKLAHIFAIAASLISGLLIIYCLLIVLLPKLLQSVISIITLLPDTVQRTMKWLREYFQDNPTMLNYLNDFSESVLPDVQAWSKDELLPSIQSLMNGISNSIISVFAWIKNIVIGIIVSVYVLNGRKKFAVQGKLCLYGIFKKEWADWILKELAYADRMFSGFLSGKLLDSAIIGIICAIGCAILKIPNVMLISVIIGVTNIIPYFGPFIGAIPSEVLILIESPIKCIWFVIFIIILQQIDGNIIGPKILGNTTGLSSFWVLFSILLFGGLWGFIGMIIGVPLFAVFYDGVRKLVVHGLKLHNQEELLDKYNSAKEVKKSTPKGKTIYQRIIEIRNSKRKK
mgnify:CR=1 FL=1